MNTLTYEDVMGDDQVREWRQATLENRADIIELKTKVDLHIERFERHLEANEVYHTKVDQHQQWEKGAWQDLHDDINGYRKFFKGVVWSMFAVGAVAGFVLRYAHEIAVLFRGQ